MRCTELFQMPKFSGCRGTLLVWFATCLSEHQLRATPSRSLSSTPGLMTSYGWWDYHIPLNYMYLT